MKLLSKRELRDLLVKSGYSLPVNYFNSVLFDRIEDNCMIYTVTIPDDSGIDEFVTDEIIVTLQDGQPLFANFA